MPTGYTADIQDGNTDFKSFLLNCARAFGACIMQRDEPSNAPPKEQPIDNYHLKGKAEDLANLKKIEAMSDEQVKDAAESEYRDALQYRKEYIQKKNRTRANYEAVLEAAKAWEPPTTEHQGLKDLMIDQLVKSIDFDCGSYTPSVPEVISGEQWKRNRIDRLKQSIARHEEEYEKEVERTTARNKWIRDLYNSLQSIPA